jgi:hypothetical protein
MTPFPDVREQRAPAVPVLAVGRITCPLAGGTTATTPVAVAVPVFLTTMGWGWGRPVIVAPVAGGTLTSRAGTTGCRDTMQFGPDAREVAVAVMPSGPRTVQVADRLSGIFSTVNTASCRPGVNMTGCCPLNADGPTRLFLPSAMATGPGPFIWYPKDAV